MQGEFMRRLLVPYMADAFNTLGVEFPNDTEPTSNITLPECHKKMHLVKDVYSDFKFIGGEPKVKGEGNLPS
jgi:hypothetical protein